MFEYKMSAEMAESVLKDRKGEDKKLRSQDYLVKYVNEQFGLRLPVVRVIVE